MKIQPLLFVAFFLGFLAIRTSATTYYVDINSATPTAPYTNWATASTDIQSAINETTNGDLVLVADGTYLVSPVNAGTGNSVSLNQAITVESVNGPATTTISGQSYPAPPNGPARGANLAAGATLIGFTVTGGNSANGGAGVYCQSSSVVSNCIVAGNTEIFDGGGGVWGGTLYNCTIENNSASAGGGGVVNATLYNCTVSGNKAAGNGSQKPGSGGGVFNCVCYNCILNGNTAEYVGGGAYGGTLNNCLVTGNTSEGGPGGGTEYGTLNNCTVSGNTAAYPWPGGGVDESTANNTIAYGNSPDDIDTLFSVNFCCAPSLTNGPGNITANPDFVSGSYQLQYNSPCIGTGNTNYVTTATDLNGNPRIVNGTVDMGAYEFQPQTITIVTEPLSQTIAGGQPASFNISVACEEPLVYQWQFGGTNIVGANGTNFLLTDIQSNNAGSYDVIVSNSQITVTSSPAILTVIYPSPVIVQEPTNLIVLPGSTAALSVNAASYYPVTFQWLFNGTNLSDGGQITGSTNSVLNISDAQPANTGPYQVIVANEYGAVTSTVAILNAGPFVRYVNLNNPTPAFPYLSWNTAATDIQTAINACAYGDQVIVTDGVYTSSGYTTPGGGISCVVDTNAISLQSVNGAATTLICGSNLMRCVYLGNSATLAGFTLTNGFTTGSGGGVYCGSTNSFISNCLFINNVANQAGGGVFSGTLNNCTLVGNVSQTIGAGAFGSVLTNCLLTGNSATNSINRGGGGGAANCTFNNCYLNGNLAILGGGAYGSTLNGCTVSNNLAIAEASSQGEGGGVNGCTVQNSLIISNAALSLGPNFGYGGGAYNSTLSYCVIQGNHAWEGGGVLELSPFSLGLSHCALIGNWAFSMGGFGASGQPILTNCVIGGNLAGTYAGVYSAQLFNCSVIGNTATNSDGGTYNCIAKNSIIYYNTAQQFPNVGGGISAKNCCLGQDVTSGSGFFTNAPLLMNLAAGDFHLQSNSPCINAGNNAYTNTTTDLDGNPRIVGGTVDIGAYEYQTPVSMLPYLWLEQYGLSITNNVDTSSPNGTAFDVYQDWVAGLNPTNPASVLVLLPPAQTNNASGINVTWQSVSGINYFVQRSTNLSSQPPFSTIQSSIAGQAGTTSYNDTSATNPVSYFYRVGVP